MDRIQDLKSGNIAIEFRIGYDSAQILKLILRELKDDDWAYLDDFVDDSIQSSYGDYIYFYFDKNVARYCFDKNKPNITLCHMLDVFDDNNTNINNELKQIAIQLLPALIERAATIHPHGVSRFEFNHESVVKQSYKFAEEVVRQGGGK